MLFIVVISFCSCNKIEDCENYELNIINTFDRVIILKLKTPFPARYRYCATISANATCKMVFDEPREYRVGLLDADLELEETYRINVRKCTQELLIE